MADAQNLFQDWYDTYVLPKKAPMAGVFSRNKPDLGLGLPASPTPAPAAPVTPPAAPENPLTDYTPQPEPAAETPGPSWLDKLSSSMSESKGMSPGAMGILGMGLSMAATPPRAVPYSNAEIIGQSGLHGLAFYEKALEDKRRQQALDVSAEEHKLTREDQTLYRQGMLEDRAAQRVIQKQNADSAEAIRKATAESRTGKLVPVKQADGTVAYERMLDAVGQEVPQKPERLVPVKQADGSVTYAPASEAAGQAVPQKAGQRYRNVPGKGLYDVSGPEPILKVPAPVFGRGGGAGGRPTANIQNIEYLVGNGWDRKEAENMILQGKRMPRETFIANMTKSIYGNEFIDDADKANKMQEAIKFYDSTIPQRGGEKKPPPAGKTLDQATATSILQEAGGDKDKARKIAKERGYQF